MIKTLVIARREYTAAVKTKSFIISVVLLPVMMFGGVVAQRLTRDLGDVSDRRVAVIDRTPGEVLIDGLIEAAEQRNARVTATPQRQTESRFLLHRIEPPADGEGAELLRAELSDLVRHGELFAFVEIGQDVILSSPGSLAARDADPLRTFGATPTVPDEIIIRYTSNRPTDLGVQNWAQQALLRSIVMRRAVAAGVPPGTATSLMIPPLTLPKPLAHVDQAGQVRYEPEENRLATFIVPAALVILTFVVVLVGASPLTTNTIEEKQLRIAEVLIGSVRPFDLMLGKLLGGVGVSVTLAVIYIGGAIWAAHQAGWLELIPVGALPWLALFLVLATLMYGAMFVAVGAAVSDVKQAQALIMPMMLIIVLPLMLFGQILQHPDGTIATVLTFFPLSAPMITVARLTIPPYIPVWQTILAAIISIVTTLALVWAAGRIFRVGILLQGQGARVGEMLRWILGRV
jgi:ABC-2 type transport system permease protein